MKLFFKHSLSFFSLVLCITSSIYTMEEQTKKFDSVTTSNASSYNYSARPLFIFLDGSEKSLGPVSNGFMETLNKKAGPIIVSKYLIDLIFGAENQLRVLLGEYKNLSEIQQLLEETDHKRLYDNACQPLNIQDQDLNQFSSNKKELYILTKASSFNEKEWLIKKINDYLLLFVPYEYLKSLGINENDAQQSPSHSSSYPQHISNAELTLGLKINHMHLVNDLASFARTPTRKKLGFDFIDSVYNSQENKSSIFCVRSDYAHKKVISLPQWSIYMDGHGIMRIQIVGLGLSTFKNFLDFLDSRLNTKLLIYDSCYAAGITHEDIYKRNAFPLGQPYSFPIITQALTDATTITDDVSLFLDKNKNKLYLKFQLNFEKLCQEMIRTPLDYQRIALLLQKNPLNTKYAHRNLLWGNVPQRKLPNTEWFDVFEDQKKIVSIGSILSITRDKDKPLSVTNFFKTNPQVLLLRTHTTPFDLVLDGNNLKAIISMIPGDTTHTINKIVAGSYCFSRIFSYFQCLKTIQAEKTFYIKELVCIYGTFNDILITNKIDKKQIKVFYSIDACNFLDEGNGKTTILESNTAQFDQYKNLLIKVKNIDMSNQSINLTNLNNHVKQRTIKIQELKQQSIVINNKFKQWAAKKRETVYRNIN